MFVYNLLIIYFYNGISTYIYIHTYIVLFLKKWNKMFSHCNEKSIWSIALSVNIMFANFVCKISCKCAYLLSMYFDRLKFCFKSYDYLYKKSFLQLFKADVWIGKLHLPKLNFSILFHGHLTKKVINYWSRYRLVRLISQYRSLS